MLFRVPGLTKTRRAGELKEATVSKICVRCQNLPSEHFVTSYNIRRYRRSTVPSWAGNNPCL